MKKLRRPWLFPAFVFLTLFALFNHNAAIAQDAAGRSPAEALRQAEAAIGAAESYRYRATLVQDLFPRPIAANIGKQGEQVDWTLDTVVAGPERSMIEMRIGAAGSAAAGLFAGPSGHSATLHQQGDYVLRAGRRPAGAAGHAAGGGHSRCEYGRLSFGRDQHPAA